MFATFDSDLRIVINNRNLIIEEKIKVLPSAFIDEIYFCKSGFFFVFL